MGIQIFAAVRLSTATGGASVAVAVGVEVGSGVGVGGIAYSVNPAVFPLTVAY